MPDWISMVIRDICEIPYRDSPEDFPDAMVVTPAELRDYIELHAPAAALQPAPDAPKDRLVERLLEDAQWCVDSDLGDALTKAAAALQSQAEQIAALREALAWYQETERR